MEGSETESSYDEISPRGRVSILEDSSPESEGPGVPEPKSSLLRTIDGDSGETMRRPAAAGAVATTATTAAVTIETTSATLSATADSEGETSESMTLRSFIRRLREAEDAVMSASPTVIVREFRDFCLPCAVFAGKKAKHPISKCRSAKNRCLKCFERGHSGLICTFDWQEVEAGKVDKCISCGIDHRGILEGECAKVMEKTMEISLMIWEGQPHWLHLTFRELEYFCESREEFVKWLFKKRGPKLDEMCLLQLLRKWKQFFHTPRLYKNL